MKLPSFVVEKKSRIQATRVIEVRSDIMIPPNFTKYVFNAIHSNKQDTLTDIITKTVTQCFTTLLKMINIHDRINHKISVF